MNRTTTLGFVLFAFCIICNSCKKATPCTDSPNVHYKMSDDTLKVPYTGRDTLRFAHYVDSVLIDTIIWIGQGKTYSETDEGFTTTGDGTCGYETYGQTRSITYKANKPGYNMIFRVVAYYDATDNDNFYIDIISDELWDLLWIVNNRKYIGYYPQKIVNGKLYYDVNFFDQRGLTKSFNLYYTVEKGIIRIEMLKKHVFSLVD